MKINKYIILALSCIGILSCSNEFDVSDKAPGVLSVAGEHFKIVESYAIEELYKADLSIHRGGLAFENSVVTFSVDKSLLESLNQNGGNSYQMLPESCYELSKETIDIKNENTLSSGYISYSPDKIVALSGFNRVKYVLPLRATSVGLPMNPVRDILLLGFTVSEPIIKILNANIQEINLTEDSSLDLPIELGVDFTNKWDIKCSIEFNQSIVDEYNAKNKTYFKLLPQSMFTYPSDILLNKGAKNTIIPLKLVEKKIQPGNYILPVSIKSIDAMLDGAPTDVIKVDKEHSSIFCISKLGDKLDKSTWSIASVNSEEATGENNGKNGRAIHLIDNNTKTFWHSKWSGGSNPLPYEIVIDMKKNILISQVELLPRGFGSNNPLKQVQFEVSSNNLDWKKIGSFEFSNINTALTYAVKTSEARYLKFICPDSGGNTTVASVRELDVRGVVLD